MTVGSRPRLIAPPRLSVAEGDPGKLEISATTGALTVTTWGSDPASLAAAPAVASRGEVTPQ